jgi:tetraacyldisaccharide 4'-kinase
LYLRNLLYDFKILRPKKLPVPVISVGNITVGGTGKTPFTINLVSLISQAGYQKPAVLSRGYKREDEKKFLKVKTSDSFLETGDEPLLIKTAIGEKGEVFVGSNRFKAGKQALNENNIDIFILDDGYQHRQLFRNLDIVLIDCTNPFGNRILTPYGSLREEISGLKRADIFILNRAKYVKDKTLIKATLHAHNKTAEIFEADMELKEFFNPFTNETFTIQNMKDKKCLSFAGIGNPLAFKADLITAGLNIPRAFAMKDHAVPTPSQLQKINDIAIKEDVEYIITTEKDWIKLKDEQVDKLFTNLLIAKGKLVIQNTDKFIKLVKEKLNG